MALGPFDLLAGILKLDSRCKKPCTIFKFESDSDVVQEKRRGWKMRSL